MLMLKNFPDEICPNLDLGTKFQPYVYFSLEYQSHLESLSNEENVPVMVLYNIVRFDEISTNDPRCCL